MANKTYTVDFKLPQLPAGHYWQSVVVEAPSIGRAADLAWKIVKARAVVKGRRIKEATISVQQKGNITDD